MKIYWNILHFRAFLKFYPCDWKLLALRNAASPLVNKAQASATERGVFTIKILKGRKITKEMQRKWFCTQQYKYEFYVEHKRGQLLF